MPSGERRLFSDIEAFYYRQRHQQKQWLLAWQAIENGLGKSHVLSADPFDVGVFGRRGEDGLDLVDSGPKETLAEC